ncbi:hypothetical protein [Streptomyces sp. NPDC056660]|uniref:hypothetical protein n=1 Tax=Streptomyces sp. NPDC056660 TaxID=3345897 RepID=UPI0036A6FCF1
MATDLYAHLAPRLHIAQSDAVSHLHTMPDTYDVPYRVFGALDFTDLRKILPAVAAALKPGGRLAYSALAHYPCSWRTRRLMVVLPPSAARAEMVPGTASGSAGAPLSLTRVNSCCVRSVTYLLLYR